jgi:hypothetical protein
MVECFLPKCQIVLGRFEEVAKQQPKDASSGGSGSGDALDEQIDALVDGGSLALGRDYPRQELFDEVKTPDQPFGKWFRGTVVPKAADRACFLLNGNRQSWHYGWQSSRLNCKNLHVFKVYFFNQSERDPARLNCVAALASPAFRISSSRKARKTFRSPVLTGEDEEVGVAGSITLDVAPASAPGGHFTHNGSPPLSMGMAVTPASSPVPSIDEFLGQKPNANAPVPPFPMPNGTPMSANSYLLAAAASGRPSLQRLGTEKDQAGRVRKRLTRSASLKSDYFATVSFPSIQQQQLQQQQQRLSMTHPIPPSHHQRQPQLASFQEDRASTPALPSMAFLNSTTAPRSTGGINRSSSSFHMRRSSLAALPMPVSAPLGSNPTPHGSSSSSSGARQMPVLTPITGMMQLRLESPHPREVYPPTSSSSTSTSTTARQPRTRTSRSMSTNSALRPAPAPARLTAAALHQHAYASANPYAYRRDAWGTGGAMMPNNGMGGIPSLMMMPPGSDVFLNRKRNRSTDSDKAIAAAIDASEHIVPTPSLSPSLSPLSSPGHTVDTSSTDDSFSNSPSQAAAAAASDVNDADTELFRRARILQLAFTVVRRIHRFEQVAKASMDAPRKVVRHSFEMLTPAGARHQDGQLVQIPLSKPKLLHLCSNLVTVCTRLVRGGLVEEVRRTLCRCAQNGASEREAYTALLDVLDSAVRDQVSRLPRHVHRSWGDAESEDEGGVWDLYDMLKSCEAWLMQEPWWTALDADDMDSDTSEDGKSVLPYMSSFRDYYGAVKEAIPSPQDLEVAVSLRAAAQVSGQSSGLTGEWFRLGDSEDHAQPMPARARRSTAAASTSWFERYVHAHTTEVFHLTETATTMTLALPHSLVSADAVFLLQLNQQEPTVVIPQDYFPFGWARKRAMVAYRAWRVRDVGDKNGSAVAVQFMRWPTRSSEVDSDEDDEEEEEEEEDDDDDDDSDEPEEEPHARRQRQAARRRWPRRRRTRVTIYFSEFSTNRLQLRTIVETSMAAPAASVAPVSSADASASTSSPSSPYPTEAEMLQYFKSPSSWELRAQTTQQYEKRS